jgi:hypothetical protein
MTPKTPVGMIVVKKEEKEPKLRTLLAAAIEAIGTQDGLQQAPILRLLAASSASPVARAVASLQSELTAAGIETLIVLAKSETVPLMNVGAASTYRHLADARCHDAHELMVLGATAVWVGDCLRRDPAIRDSYELHASDAPDTARLTALSFDRLWSRAAPVVMFAAAPPADFEMAANLAAIGPDQPSQPTALTRH